MSSVLDKFSAASNLIDMHQNLTDKLQVRYIFAKLEIYTPSFMNICQHWSIFVRLNSKNSFARRRLLICSSHLLFTCAKFDWNALSLRYMPQVWLISLKFETYAPKLDIRIWCIWLIFLELDSNSANPRTTSTNMLVSHSFHMRRDSYSPSLTHIREVRLKGFPPLDENYDDKCVNRTYFHIQLPQRIFRWMISQGSLVYIVNLAIVLYIQHETNVNNSS